MEKNSYIRRTCRLCGERNLKTVLTLKPSPIADEYIARSKANIAQPRYPLTLLLCTNCGQVQLRDVVRPQKLYKNYTYVTNVSLGLTKHYQLYAQDIVKSMKIPKHSLVVDIGSNDGTILKEFKRLDMNVLGVEPAKKIATDATKSGIPTIPQFFTPRLAQRIQDEYGAATIITANNVLANVDDLDEFMEGIKLLMSHDSLFIFESIYLKDIIKHLVFDSIYHEHLSYFSVTPLVPYMKKQGLECIDVINVPTKGGSLRYIAQLVGGPRKISRSVNTFVQREKRFGLESLSRYKLFESHINTAKKDLKRLLSRLKTQKKSIAGFGASASSTTFLYHFELHDKIDFLIDENRRKIGTLSPGFHIPVISPDMLRAKKPDFVIVLAWRYAESIVNKYVKYRKLGGCFIVPLPKLHII